MVAVQTMYAHSICGFISSIACFSIVVRIAFTACFWFSIFPVFMRFWCNCSILCTCEEFLIEKISSQQNIFFLVEKYIRVSNSIVKVKGLLNV